LLKVFEEERSPEQQKYDDLPLRIRCLLS